MKKSGNVQKSDNQFLDSVFEAARGKRVKLKKEQTRYEFRGYGIKTVSRVQETITAEIESECNDDGA